MLGLCVYLHVFFGEEASDHSGMLQSYFCVIKVSVALVNNLADTLGNLRLSHQPSGGQRHCTVSLQWHGFLVVRCNREYSRLYFRHRNMKVRNMKESDILSFCCILTCLQLS